MAVKVEGPIADRIDRYLAGRVERREISALSARALRCGLESFAVSFGRRPVERMGRRDIERWLADIAHMRPASRRAYQSTVNRFCAWLVREEILRRNPCTDVPRVREPRTTPKVFDTDEIARLLDACPDARARLIVLLIVQLGLRCVEVARLELGDVERDHVHVVGKGGHERDLYLVPQVRRAVDEYLAEERGGAAGPLIANRLYAGLGVAPRTVGCLVGEWIAAAGLKRYAYDGRSAHGGRRTAATDMLAAGASIEEVAEVLGHADLASVRRYALPRAARLRAAMDGRWYGRRPLRDVETA